MDTDVMTATTTEQLTPIVRRALDRSDAEIDRWELVPADHCVDNMTTERLDRVRGSLDDGTPWSLFAKTLHPASASPHWALIPDFAHADLLRELDWRDEPRAYRCGLTADVPDGLRMPRLWHLDEDDDRIVLWLEDVEDRAVWDLPTYRRAAEGLGRLAGRWPQRRVDAELGLRRRRLAEYVDGKVVHAVLPWLADDATWSDPMVAAATASDPDLRSDLARLADDLPDLVGRLDDTDHALGHGDATPANILDDGTDLVLVDWSYGSSMAGGTDLAQLVAGAYDGRAEGDVGLMAPVHDIVVDAYCAGLAAEGAAVAPGDVVLAYLVTLAVRSALTALDLSHVADLPEERRAALLHQRVALARLALDRLAAVRR
jgi:hypothetical protein